MSVKAADIDEPMVLIERVAYRNARLLTRVELHDDPVRFVRIMAGRNRTDLRRIAELMDFELPTPA